MHRIFQGAAVYLLGILLISGCSTISQKKQKEPEVNLAPIYIDPKRGEGVGFIDDTGKVVINQRFHKAFPFSEGLALVYEDELSRSNVRAGRDIKYIDKNGKTVISVKGLRASYFRDGLAVLERWDGEADESEYVYINKKGEIAIPGPFTYATDFSDGVAAVQGTYNRRDYSSYINTKGEIKLPFSSSSNAPAFSEGFVKTEVRERGTAYIFRRKEDGSPLRTPYFEKVRSFSEGLAAVAVVISESTWEGSDTRWGYLDKEGGFSIEPKYLRASSFSQGLACVADETGYYFIDKQGKKAIEQTFSGCVPFHENGLAGVKKDGKVGYINKQGSFVIPLSKEYTLKSDSLISQPEISLKGGGNWRFRKYKGKLIEVSLVKNVTSQEFKTEQEFLLYFDGNGKLVYEHKEPYSDQFRGFAK